MGLDVCLERMGVPRRVGDKLHERVRAVDVAPVNPPDPVELDLQWQSRTKQQSFQSMSEEHQGPACEKQKQQQQEK